jgi:hypothetical protein
MDLVLPLGVYQSETLQELYLDWKTYAMNPPAGSGGRALAFTEPATFNRSFTSIENMTMQFHGDAYNSRTISMMSANSRTALPEAPGTS